MFKHGRREDLLAHGVTILCITEIMFEFVFVFVAPSVLTCLSTSNVFHLFNTLLRKLAVKLVQVGCYVG